ncbi:hypothetical protein AA105894_1204 [Asaia spathodeae NBRC 105894]|nr:hypothetical protein AA105894_1204 [Asaia spathodeae NBRC 105894]
MKLHDPVKKSGRKPSGNMGLCPPFKKAHLVYRDKLNCKAWSSRKIVIGHALNQENFQILGKNT